MAFSEIRFPDDIAYGSSGGPEYATEIITTEGGHEKRNIYWQNARARYNVAHGVKTQEQLDTLLAFFRARKGRAYGFRFKDWSDYSATNQNIGVGNSVTTDFQLSKLYTSGNDTELRIINKPVNGTVKIYIDSIEQTTGFTVDTTDGTISFANAPATGEIITADFEFDVAVRFDTDYLHATLESYGIHSWNNIPLIELRL